MFSPVFVITNKLLKIIASAESSKDAIESYLINETKLKELQDENIVKKIYYQAHIDGNELTLSQSKQILEGASSFVNNRDVQEVINFRRCFNIIEEIKKTQSPYMVDWLRDLHAAAAYNILPPEKAGALRNSQVVIRDEETGEVLYTPPQSSQIVSLIEEFFVWLNSNEAKEIHPIIKASICEYIIVFVHPFVEANDSVARMFFNLVLEKEGFGIEGLLLYEEEMELTVNDYFDALYGNLSSNENLATRNITGIIEFLSNLVANNLVNLKEKLKELETVSPSKLKISDEIALSARQMKLLNFISENGRAVMKELKGVVPEISDDTILRDLTALVKKGIIEKEGTTKASSYILKK